jgi:hypothetical protein
MSVFGTVFSKEASKYDTTHPRLSLSGRGLEKSHSLDQAGFDRQFEEVPEGVVVRVEEVECVPLALPEVRRRAVLYIRCSLEERMAGNRWVSVDNAGIRRPQRELHLLGTVGSRHHLRLLVVTERDDRQSIARH